jgi:hypothetical protein
MRQRGMSGTLGDVSKDRPKFPPRGLKNPPPGARPTLVKATEIEARRATRSIVAPTPSPISRQRPRSEDEARHLFDSLFSPQSGEK